MKEVGLNSSCDLTGYSSSNAPFSTIVLICIRSFFLHVDTLGKARPVTDSKLSHTYIVAARRKGLLEEDEIDFMDLFLKRLKCMKEEGSGTSRVKY